MLHLFVRHIYVNNCWYIQHILQPQAIVPNYLLRGPAFVIVVSFTIHTIMNEFSL